MWPFSRFPSAAKFSTLNCRWCPTRIGDDGRYPILLCGACFVKAWEDKAPGTPMRARLFEEFPAEVRKYLKLAMRRRA